MPAVFRQAAGIIRAPVYWKRGMKLPEDDQDKWKHIGILMDCVNLLTL
jgi:hypothetical protein